MSSACKLIDYFSRLKLNNLEKLSKLQGYTDKELIIKLQEVCASPELKLNSRDIAQDEIDLKIMEYQNILEVKLYFWHLYFFLYLDYKKK